MATQPSLRIGDKERDAVAAELREHFAIGRLSLEEFNHRLDAVFAAKTQSDLDRITSDLPHVRSGGAPLPSPRSAASNRLPDGTPWPGPGREAMATAAGWTGGDWTGGDWTSRDRRPRAGFAALATLLAAIASWLIVYDVLLVGVRFPWPGRLGLLVAIFTLIRGLLRRIIRSPRR
jgi:Domain of unknown function (DUF1707)